MDSSRYTSCTALMSAAPSLIGRWNAFRPRMSPWPPMRFGEGLTDLFDLADRALGSEVDRRADADGAQVRGQLRRREEPFVVAVRIAQQVVVVDLHDERNPVHVATRN